MNTAAPVEDYKTTSGEVGKPTKPLVVKYTTHLAPEVVKWIKREALERDMKDYQIVQQAIREFQINRTMTS